MDSSEQIAASVLTQTDQRPRMQDDLMSLIVARHRILHVRSTDEEVEMEALLEVGRRMDRTVQDWTLTTGMRVFSPDVREPAGVSGTTKIENALQYILRQKRAAIHCLRGIAPYTTQPLIRRLLKDFVATADPDRECLVLIEEEALHPRIQRLVVPWNPGLPDQHELHELVKQTYRRVKKSMPAQRIVADISRHDLDQLVLNLRGLTRTEAAQVVESVILDDRRLNASDLQRVIDAKRRVLEGAGSLESMTIDFEIDEVGGLRGLKKWLSDRRGGFSDNAREFGIEPPRGVLMLGVPGCGKSLCAKAVAADWGMPLLRLDPGVLYNKFVGESENQLRQAIQQAEAMAPVVLWIDEIEKAFASASSTSADGGLSQRMFGTLLSWMQDHREPIFIVATANDISALPPELMRKGRFDEVFFIDLPSVDARRRIFQIHLQRRKRDASKFRVDELADASKDLTGSEIEQAIVSGLFRAFSDARELSTEDILKAIAETRPLSSLMAEKIESLRTWAANRCVPAD
ncbi:MAG: AAA family ATPase [Fuerstiella sp.]